MVEEWTLPQQGDRAHIAVLQNASLRAHYASTAPERFEHAGTSWADLTFYEDGDVEALARHISDGWVDALVVASGAMESPSLREALASGPLCAATASAVEGGMGVLILHQGLSPAMPTLSLSFLPTRLTLTLTSDRGPTYFSIDHLRVAPFRLLARDGSVASDPEVVDELARGERNLSAWYGNQLDFTFPMAWRTLVEDTRTSTALISRSREEEAGLVIVSSIPLDFNQTYRVLRALIARCVRERACLMLSEVPHTQSHELPYLRYMADAGVRVHRQVVSDLTAFTLGGSDALFFRHLAFGPERNLDELSCLSSDDIFSLLENGVSVAGFTLGPGTQRMLVQIAGTPAYVDAAEEYASWLAPKLPSLVGAWFETRAVAIAACVTRSVYRDPYAIPVSLRLDTLHGFFADFLSRHIASSGEGPAFLSFAACAAACKALGMETEVLAAVTAARKNLHQPDRMELSQAMLWVEEMSDSADMRQAHAHAPSSGTALEDVYERLRNFKYGTSTRADQAHLYERMQSASEELSVRAEIWLTVWEVEAAKPEVSDGPTSLPDQLQSVGETLRDAYSRLKHGNGSTETVSLLAAVNMALSAAQPLQALSQATPTSTDVPESSDARLEIDRALALETAHLTTAKLRQELATVEESKEALSSTLDAFTMAQSRDEFPVRLGRVIATIFLLALVLAVFPAAGLIVHSVRGAGDRAEVMSVMLIVWGFVVTVVIRLVVQRHALPARVERAIPVFITK